jgi:hypothetical protein
MTPPHCYACQFGKQTRRHQGSVVKDCEGALKKDNLFAGQHVLLDHCVCGTKGRLFTSMGKTSDSDMFDGSCVFIDSATGFIHPVLQVNLNTHEMLNAIHEFEQVCRDHGVVPQLYHSNNASVFTSEGMAEKLKRFAQIKLHLQVLTLIIIMVWPSVRLERLQTWRAR